MTGAASEILFLQDQDFYKQHNFLNTYFFFFFMDVTADNVMPFELNA